MKEEVVATMSTEMIPIPAPEPIQPDKLAELFKKLPDPTAREAIIVGNMRLVYHILKRYGHWSSDYPFEDMVSAGMIGLIKAVDTYDTTAKTKFNTYAGVCILNEVRMGFRSVYRKMEHEINFTDQLAILPDRWNPDSDDDDIIMRFISNHITDNDGMKDPCQDIVDDEANKIILGFVELLPPKDQMILKMYYGIGYPQPYKQMAIAEECGVQQASVSRSLKRSMTKIRKEAKKVGLYDKT